MGSLMTQAMREPPGRRERIAASAIDVDEDMRRFFTLVVDEDAVRGAPCCLDVGVGHVHRDIPGLSALAPHIDAVASKASSRRDIGGTDVDLDRALASAVTGIDAVAMLDFDRRYLHIDVDVAGRGRWVVGFDVGMGDKGFDAAAQLTRARDVGEENVEVDVSVPVWRA